MEVVRGRVVSFDRIKGYGFVTPDTGGEDVFIHVNDLHSDKSLLTPGCLVDFRLDEGDRGPKASEITVVQPVTAAASPAQSTAAHPDTRPAAPEPADAAPRPVLAPDVFEHEVTEALLRVEPELTSRQVLDIRKRLLRIAQSHTWVEH